MKLKFNFLAIFALLFIVSCSSDDDDPVVNISEAIQGSYNGYTVAEFKYTEVPMTTADETVVLTANADGTCNVSFTSSQWGTFTVSNSKVTLKDDTYTIMGSGKTVMGMSEEAKKEYACDFEGSVSKDKKTVSFLFDVPSVMGGLKITFKLGDAPVADVIAGTYKGELSLSVGTTNLDPVKDSKVTIKSQENGKAEVTLAGFDGMPGMSLEDIVIADVAVVSEKGVYTLSGTINAKSGTINITGKIDGNIAKDEANITFEIKPGAMPFPITAVFKGKK